MACHWEDSDSVAQEIFSNVCHWCQLSISQIADFFSPLIWSGFSDMHLHSIRRADCLIFLSIMVHSTYPSDLICIPEIPTIMNSGWEIRPSECKHSGYLVIPPQIWPRLLSFCRSTSRLQTHLEDRITVTILPIWRISAQSSFTWSIIHRKVISTRCHRTAMWFPMSQLDDFFDCWWPMS